MKYFLALLILVSGMVVGGEVKNIDRVSMAKLINEFVIPKVTMDDGTLRIVASKVKDAMESGKPWAELVEGDVSAVFQNDRGVMSLTLENKKERTQTSVPDNLIPAFIDVALNLGGSGPKPEDPPKEDAPQPVTDIATQKTIALAVVKQDTEIMWAQGKMKFEVSLDPMSMTTEGMYNFDLSYNFKPDSDKVQDELSAVISSAYNVLSAKGMLGDGAVIACRASMPDSQEPGGAQKFGMSQAVYTNGSLSATQYNPDQWEFSGAIW